MKHTKLLIISALFASCLTADPKMVGRDDFVNFYYSSQLKEEIRAEILREVNASFEAAKEELFEQIKTESDRQRRLYTAQTDELSRQIIKLKEELSFMRELVVDANYQRNSKEDVVTLLQKKLDDIEAKVGELSKQFSGEMPAPEIPNGGRQL